MKMAIAWFNYSVRNARRLLTTILMLVIVPQLSGCYYYKVHTYHSPESKKASKLISGKKYFILHQHTDVWHLKEGSVDFDGRDLEGTKEPLDSNHRYYLSVDKTHINRFRPAKRLKRLEGQHIVPDEPVYEVHIYVSDYTGDQGDDIVVPLAAIRRIEVYEIAKGATMSSQVLPVMAGCLAVFTAILIVALNQPVSVF